MFKIQRTCTCTASKNARATKKPIKMLEGSPIQLSSSIQPPIAPVLLAPVALPGRSTRDTGPKKQFRRPRRFFPLMSPPWSVLRRQCSIYTREGYLVNRIFWLGTLQISFWKIGRSVSFQNKAIEFRTPKFETSMNSKGHLWDWNKCTDLTCVLFL